MTTAVKTILDQINQLDDSNRQEFFSIIDSARPVNDVGIPLEMAISYPVKNVIQNKYKIHTVDLKSDKYGKWDPLEAYSDYKKRGGEIDESIEASLKQLKVELGLRRNLPGFS